MPSLRLRGAIALALLCAFSIDSTLAAEEATPSFSPAPPLASMRRALATELSQPGPPAPENQEAEARLREAQRQVQRARELKNQLLGRLQSDPHLKRRMDRLQRSPGGLTLYLDFLSKMNASQGRAAAFQEVSRRFYSASTGWKYPGQVYEAITLQERAREELHQGLESLETFFSYLDAISS